MYSTHQEESVIAEKFIRNLKNKIYKYMTSKDVYIDKLDNIVNKENNTNHSTNKMYLHSHILTLVKKVIIKILNLKLILLEYRNIKIFWKKVRSKLVF